MRSSSSEGKKVNRTTDSQQIFGYHTFIGDKLGTHNEYKSGCNQFVLEERFRNIEKTYITYFTKSDIDLFFKKRKYTLETIINILNKFFDVNIIVGNKKYPYHSEEMYSFTLENCKKGDKTYYYVYVLLRHIVCYPNYWDRFMAYYEESMDFETTFKLFQFMNDINVHHISTIHILEDFSILTHKKFLEDLRSGVYNSSSKYGKEPNLIVDGNLWVSFNDYLKASKIEPPLKINGKPVRKEYRNLFEDKIFYSKSNDCYLLESIPKLKFNFDFPHKEILENLDSYEGLEIYPVNRVNYLFDFVKNPSYGTMKFPTIIVENAKTKPNKVFIKTKEDFEKYMENYKEKDLYIQHYEPNDLEYRVHYGKNGFIAINQRLRKKDSSRIKKENTVWLGEKNAGFTFVDLRQNYFLAQLNELMKSNKTPYIIADIFVSKTGRITLFSYSNVIEMTKDLSSKYFSYFNYLNQRMF